MAYVPNYENDLFISYRRASNDGPDEWIDNFCKQLGAHLRDCVGDVRIWRDTSQLRAGEEWRREIAEALDSTAVFLAIISRTYLESDECRKELDYFLGRLKQSDSPRQIVPIFKHPPKKDQTLPQEVAARGRHTFYRIDDKSSEHWSELTPLGEGMYDFRKTLGQVAQDLMRTLEEFKGIAKAKSLGKVFVACVGPELHKQRAQLRSELLQRGYTVVPESEYFWHTDGCSADIGRDLADAKLCIHLVYPGASVEDGTAERARRQLELAHAEMQKRHGPPPLVWIQAGEVDASARGLVDYVRNDLANEGVEYWQGALEELKTQINKHLPAAQPAKTESAVREVLLLVEESESAAAKPLKTLMVGMGIEPRTVKLSDGTPDAKKLADAVATCRHALVFWGGRDEDWVGGVLRALPSTLGKDAVCVYAAAPLTGEKNDYVTAKASVVLASGDPGEGAVKAFLGERAPPA